MIALEGVKLKYPLTLFPLHHFFTLSVNCAATISCEKGVDKFPPLIPAQIPVALDLGSLRLLVANDHFLIRQFVRRSLIDSGFVHVDTANDGTEAVAFIDKSLQENAIYDVIFLDWNMPSLSGIDVLAHARSKPIYRSTAIVMFTAESEKANIMKAIKMGATSYILKPISPVELNKKVKEILDWLENRRVARL